MIAYHFPPLAGSSGIQRTLRFVQHLPAFGWEPIVLSAAPCAYERTAIDLVHEVPSNVSITRTLALDAARHLAVFGRYIGALARPDRWMTWQFTAVPAGLRLIKRYKPRVIWSTYPIPTAHVIASELHRRTLLPWIADFRDPMAQEGYPPDPKTWRSFKEIEERTVGSACVSVFTTPGAARTYRLRYPSAADRIAIIENGFDEESYSNIQTKECSEPLNPGMLTLLHSGIVYPSERDPSHLFAALQTLSERGELMPIGVRVRFRAPTHDVFLRNLARRFRVSDLVEVLPPIGYREALVEMLRADALLVLQAANCNEQIPAKVYEYLRAGRPILALTDPSGDTAAVLQRAGITTIVPLDSEEQIVQTLAFFLEQLRTGRAYKPQPAIVAGSSRRSRTAELVQLLSRVC